MPSTSNTYDAVTEVQDKVLDAIKQGQDATLTAVREMAEAFTSALPKVPEWTEAFATALPKLPEWAEAYTPKVPDMPVLPTLEALIGFTEKVWENQREFNMKLYEVMAPIGKSAFGAAKDSARAAKPVAEAVPGKPDPTKPEHSPRGPASKA
jgi:hypothetical protein